MWIMIIQQKLQKDSICQPLPSLRNNGSSSTKIAEELNPVWEHNID